MRRVAWLLGAVASLSVLASAAVVVWAVAHRLPALASPLAAGRDVAAGGVTWRVPADWTVRPGDVTGFPGAGGQGRATVASPAYAAWGWCPTDPASNHAFVGVARRPDLVDPREANTQAAQDWITATAAAAGGDGQVRTREQRHVRVAGGDAWLTEATIGWQGTAGCDPAAVGLDVLTLSDGHTVVALHDLGALSDGTVGQVLASVRAS